MVLSRLKYVCPSIINRYRMAICLILFFVSCMHKKETLPFYNTADFTASWIDQSDSAYNQIHRIDTFSLLDQSGNTITRDSLEGHIYVANFFFTSCPGICPIMEHNLEQVQTTFIGNPHVRIISFSVMPEVDSVKRLKEYAELHHIHQDQWHLLTGNRNQIYTLGRTSFFSERKAGLLKDSTALLHTESLLLIDSKSRIRGIYNATDTNHIRRVISDMHLLLEEEQ